MAQIDPKPIEEKKKLADLGDSLELLEDGAVRVGKRAARPTDVPERYDLPEGHPLRGKRVVRVVPAGFPDCEIDASGMLVPVGGKPEPEPEPGEINAGELGGVTRER